MTMNLRTNIVREQIQELGREFWGMMWLETNLIGIYRFLELETSQISLNTFASWIVFPEQIPQDFLKSIQKRCLERNDWISETLLNETELEINKHTKELLHFKYSNDYAAIEQFQYLYSLPRSAFDNLLKQFNEYGYLSNENMFKFYTYYSERENDGS